MRPVQDELRHDGYPPQQLRQRGVDRERHDRRVEKLCDKNLLRHLPLLLDETRGSLVRGDGLDHRLQQGVHNGHGADGDAHEKRLQRGRRGEEIVALLAEGRDFQIRRVSNSRVARLPPVRGGRLERVLAPGAVTRVAPAPLPHPRVDPRRRAPFQRQPAVGHLLHDGLHLDVLLRLAHRVRQRNHRQRRAPRHDREQPGLRVRHFARRQLGFTDGVKVLRRVEIGAKGDERRVDAAERDALRGGKFSAARSANLQRQLGVVHRGVGAELVLYPGEHRDGAEGGEEEDERDERDDLPPPVPAPLGDVQIFKHDIRRRGCLLHLVREFAPEPRLGSHQPTTEPASGRRPEALHPRFLVGEGYERELGLEVFLHLELDDLVVNHGDLVLQLIDDLLPFPGLDVLALCHVVLHSQRAPLLVVVKEHPVVLRQHGFHHLPEFELEKAPNLLLVSRVLGQTLDHDAVVGDLDRVLVHRPHDLFLPPAEERAHDEEQHATEKVRGGGAVEEIRLGQRQLQAEVRVGVSQPVALLDVVRRDAPERRGSHVVLRLPHLLESRAVPRGRVRPEVLGGVRDHNRGHVQEEEDEEHGGHPL
mmetsp:Transcript_5665/g.23278  ORF Transcript_5665/g.23278 Transcript_5665/m.23278 type:complete len:590 (-) Transcript_5665:527-2296(-)